MPDTKIDHTEHASGAGVVSHPFSLLGSGLSVRLGIALALSGLLWASVYWALA